MRYFSDLTTSAHVRIAPGAVIRRSGAMEFPTRAQQYFDKIFNPKTRVQTGSSRWLKECMVPTIAKSVHALGPMLQPSGTVDHGVDKLATYLRVDPAYRAGYDAICNHIREAR